MADTLDLLANVQFGAIEIDFLPGEPKQFAFAQARSADHVRAAAPCQIRRSVCGEPPRGRR
jgi:hypothetical protein